MAKKALITGINGQDGSYLAEFLLEKGYEVHGTIRRTSLENNSKLDNIAGIVDQVHLHTTSLEDHLGIYKLVAKVMPDECYHLAASSFVNYSFTDETTVISTNFNSTHNFLTCIKELTPNCKFYYAGSSEMIGEPDESPQNEDTRFNPRSIYGISKLASYYVVKNYRERYNIYACIGISYNHESPRRGLAFVTRKISHNVAKIHLGLGNKIEMGNIEAYRDWGYAPDFVDAMWRILNNVHGPKDYIISTGTSHSVKDLLKEAFSVVDLDYKDYISFNQNFYRPSEKVPLIGDSSRLTQDTGWTPSMDFKSMIREMVLNDIELLSGKTSNE